MNDVKKYFESKRAYAESQINKDSIAIALVYRVVKDRKVVGLGTHIATKIKTDIDKIKAIGAISHDGKQATAPFLMVGVGNNAEFEDFATESERYVSSIVASPGGEDILSADGLVSKVSNEMRGMFVNGRKAYDLEILLISFLQGLEIYRVKYDGTPHPCTGFGVIGGYKKDAPDTSSQRHEALNKLSDLYSGKFLPNLRTVKRVAREILGPDTKKEHMIEANFSSVSSE